MSREWLWAALVGMGLVTLALRASFLLLGERLRLPRGLERALAYVPPAVLAAIVAPALLAGDDGGGGAGDAPRLLAALAAALAAWRLKSLAATIVVGMVALWGLRWWLG